MVGSREAGHTGNRGGRAGEGAQWEEGEGGQGKVHNGGTSSIFNLLEAAKDLVV